MKTRNMIFIALLFAINFSIFHEYIFSYLDKHPCTTIEYVNEIEVSHPEYHHDICDIHFMYHIPFLVPNQPHYPLERLQNHLFTTVNEKYLTYPSFRLNKPPIL